jgi:hypothetical protein
MIHFNCPHCAKGFTITPEHSGKDARCPKCKSIIKIPHQYPEPAKSEISDVLQLIAIENNNPEPVQNSYLEHHQQREQQAKEWGNETERKHFWLFDIFLYPINSAGLIMLLIFAGIPIFIKLNLLLIAYLGRFNPVVGFMHIVLGVLGWGVILLIGMYKYWYFGQCIRESAEGEIRVQNGFGDTPGPWELIHTMKDVFICMLISFVPALSYGIKSGFVTALFQLLSNSCAKNTNVFYDYNFYLLLGMGIFIFPMLIMSVFIHDSIFGINPFLIVNAICKTFFTYIFVVLAFWGLFAINLGFMALGIHICIKHAQFIPVFKILWICKGLLMIYLALVFAHILGRLYYRNAEKLNWL